jgi:hypothetical protein
MRSVAGLLAVAVVGLLALGSREVGLWDGSSDPARKAADAATVPPDAVTDGAAQPDRSRSGSACDRLTDRARVLGKGTDDPQVFVRRLGRDVAGIRTGAGALLDLARGGTDEIPGGGFRAAFSDGTDGQARHFAGIAVAASYGGEEATRRISVFVRGDPPNSADGRLTEQALAFERALQEGELAPADAGAWIRGRICRAPGA